MNLHELTAREFNAFADAIMIVILVVGVTGAVFAEIHFYRKAARAGMLHYYWWLIAAMLSIFIGGLLASAVLHGGDWEGRRALVIFVGVLLAIIALLRIALMRRVDQSE
jgi:hypothetical protein